jgi:uncharacterized protein with HEPN domain
VKDRLYLDHILDCIAQVESYVGPLLAPDIPWQQVRGFRNILVHQYLGIDFEFIRDIIVSDLPVLKVNAERLRVSIDCPN